MVCTGVINEMIILAIINSKHFQVIQIRIQIQILMNMPHFLTIFTFFYLGF